MKCLATSWSYNPNIAVTTLVWANPRSLATTRGIIIIFFSSGYLDVSVPPVRLINLWIQLMIVCRNTLGFPIRKSPVITVHITSPTLIAD